MIPPSNFRAQLTPPGMSPSRAKDLRKAAGVPLPAASLQYFEASVLSCYPVELNQRM